MPTLTAELGCLPIHDAIRSIRRAVGLKSKVASWIGVLYDTIAAALESSIVPLETGVVVESVGGSTAVKPANFLTVIDDFGMIQEILVAPFLAAVLDTTKGAWDNEGHGQKRVDFEIHGG